MSYIVTVDWHIFPEHSDAFGLRAKQQANDSLNLEEHCLFFDLSRSDEDRNHFFMYEIYSNREAFDAHLASAHFKNFSKDIAEMVMTRTLRGFHKI